MYIFFDESGKVHGKPEIIMTEVLQPLLSNAAGIQESITGINTLLSYVEGMSGSK